MPSFAVTIAFPFSSYKIKRLLVSSSVALEFNVTSTIVYLLLYDVETILVALAHCLVSTNFKSKSYTSYLSSYVIILSANLLI